MNKASGPSENCSLSFTKNSTSCHCHLCTFLRTSLPLRIPFLTQPVRRAVFSFVPWGLEESLMSFLLLIIFSKGTNLPSPYSMYLLCPFMNNLSKGSITNSKYEDMISVHQALLWVILCVLTDLSNITSYRLYNYPLFYSSGTCGTENAVVFPSSFTQLSHGKLWSSNPVPTTSHSLRGEMMLRLSVWNSSKCFQVVANVTSHLPWYYSDSFHCKSYVRSDYCFRREDKIESIIGKAI